MPVEQSYVQQGQSAAPGSIASLAKRARVRIVIHRDGNAEYRLQPIGQRKIGPARNLRGKSSSAAIQTHGSAEADSAPTEFPATRDLFNLTEHPFSAAFAIGRPGNARGDSIAVEERQAELRAANVDCQRAVHVL